MSSAAPVGQHDIDGSTALLSALHLLHQPQFRERAEHPEQLGARQPTPREQMIQAGPGPSLVIVGGALREAQQHELFARLEGQHAYLLNEMPAHPMLRGVLCDRAGGL